jgi:hypothetical protein
MDERVPVSYGVVLMHPGITLFDRPRRVAAARHCHAGHLHPIPVAGQHHWGWGDGEHNDHRNIGVISLRDVLDICNRAYHRQLPRPNGWPVAEISCRGLLEPVRGMPVPAQRGWVELLVDCLEHLHVLRPMHGGKNRFVSTWAASVSSRFPKAFIRFRTEAKNDRTGMVQMAVEKIPAQGGRATRPKVRSLVDQIQ